MKKFKNPSVLLLGLIILIALFFRLFQIYDRFEFAHDGDLYSWIVKDIVINHHFRLIGQLTSAPGVFIGPFFYYSLIPFFLITNMYPIGGIILSALLAVLTLLSIYYVFSKLYNKEIGLIAAFLDAVLLQVVNFDRWVVPTIYTRIWAVWYFYCVIQLSRGNLNVLPILGFLTGLIWHVHIALLPILVAVPIALLFGKKLPTLKQAFISLIALILPSVPLVLFEIRHNFSQTYAFIDNFFVSHGGSTGFYKFDLVTTMIGKNIQTFLLSPQNIDFVKFQYWFYAFILLLLALGIKKLIKWQELIVLLSWIFSLVLFFTISSSLISEYYFSSIEIIIFAGISILLYHLYKFSKYGKIALILILSVLLFKNLYAFTTGYVYKKNYAEKKMLVETIKNDSKKNNYPCIGISYITAPGENAGFRYLLYREGVRLNHPKIEIPVYNIVIPDELSNEKPDYKFGHIGLLLPDRQYDNEKLKSICKNEDTNLTDPLFGYVE